MTPELQAVLKLQTLDSRAAALQKEIESLPKQVAEIERKLEAHTRKLEVDRNVVATNQKERKTKEDDIKVHEQKISKLRDQMLQAKNNEQYRAFQNEITYCEVEIRKAEDRILELMGEAEPLEKNVKTAEAALKEEKAKVEEEKERARKRSAEDKAFLDQAIEERKAVSSTIPPQTLAHYERIRKRWRGTAIADATDGRCSACQMKLRPQYFQELRRGDKLYFCESCGRIVYYNPPVNLEHELHSKV
ncbi:MAG TPA: C4-type zinc ribbon domain-containing protein [Bryobacteraceae bacterium]|nr:C4-type zinc ribbon domain-containing protein [Bryobacteraceae bacterium]